MDRESEDRLDRRIEALVQSVELLSLMHQDNEKRFEKFDEGISELRSLSTKLSNIIIRHDEWLEDHEKRLDSLDGGAA